ncbi:MAG: four helix bundle protein [Candidatus Peribacteraceae bacterium]|jgi:four helix bundle protein
MGITSYRDLTVWQKSIQLVKAVYEVTEHFPKSEQCNLVSQMRRCAVSIPSNIAEGQRRSSRKDFRHFLFHAFGSGAELETQIEIAKQLPFGAGLQYEQADQLLSEVMKMLNVLITKLDE